MKNNVNGLPHDSSQKIYESQNGISDQRVLKVILRTKCYAR